MKKLLFLMLPFAFLVACDISYQERVATTDEPTAESHELALDITQASALQYGNIQIFPIVAKEGFYAENETAANMKNLPESMEAKGFYVTERKPYGRMGDAGAVNALTVQNKTNSPVYLMQGDVVTGGNQDRVIAEDAVIAVRSIQHVNVYCVEKGRWKYREDEVDENDLESVQKRKIYAFSGYYNVASNKVRKTVRETKDQQSVWAIVGEVTSQNKGESRTHTYAGLEGSEQFTNERDAYVNHLSAPLSHIENCVGFVAVSGNEVIGMDVFGHPNLFKKQYPALLHGYVTDAITTGSPVAKSAATMEKYSQRLDARLRAAQREDLFRYNGELIHFSEL